MTGMILAHAIQHHPLRFVKVWGVKVHNFTNRAGVKYYTYSVSKGGYTFGRLPPGMELALAVECYINSLETWNNVFLTRTKELGVGSGTIVTYENHNALDCDGYDMPKNDLHERLKIKRATMPKQLLVTAGGGI